MNSHTALEPDTLPESLSARPAADGAAAARAGENPLSEREMDVARLLATGASNSDIAAELIISPHTVKVHLRNIYEKLGVNSRTEASMLLVSQGWIALPGVDAAIDVADEDEAPDPPPLGRSSGAPFAWQRLYLLLTLLLSLGVLLTPFFTRRVASVPNLLSDGNAMALGRPAVLDLPRWESRTPLGRSRSRLALVNFHDSALYAIGGESAQGQPVRDVDLYDLQVNEWRTAAPLPVPLANSGVAADDSRIFVAGGTTLDSSGELALSDLLFSYNPADNLWNERAELPLPLSGAALVKAGNDLYLLGGWDGGSVRAEVWRIPAGAVGARPEEWQLVTRMESGRAFAGAVVVGDDIFIVGGYDGQRELSSAKVYNTLRGEWRDLPDLATRRGGLALLYDGLAVFAVGGGWTQPVDTIERFDPATGLWSNFPAPIAGEWRHLGGAASTLGRLYLVGGWSGSYLDVHLRYQSSFRTFFPSTKKDDGDTVVPQK